MDGSETMNEDEHEELRCTDCGEVAEICFEPMVMKMHYFCEKCNKDLVTRGLTREEKYVGLVVKGMMAKKDVKP